MYQRYLFAGGLLLSITTFLTAQVEGLWVVRQVQVGEETMTPLAKWFDFASDGSYTAGNGWLQNDYGTWSADAERKELAADTRIGIRDQAGPFRYSVTDSTMQWQREEEGQLVTIDLSRAEEPPLHPADAVVGLWQRENEAGAPETGHQLFLRWDRIFIENDPEQGRQTGYWHVQAHNPELGLIYHDTERPRTYWRLTTSADQLVLENVHDGRRRTYRRIQQFPE
jgi:hypothetical protein